MQPKALSVRIPQVLQVRFANAEPITGLSVTHQARRMLAQLLRELPSLASLPNVKHGVPGVAVPIVLTPQEQAALDAWRKRLGLAVEDAQILGNLLLGEASKPLALEDARQAAGTRLDHLIALLGLRPRLAQQRVFEAVLRRLNAPRHECRVLFVEASTGVGKTLAFLAAAIDRLGSRKTLHGVVACPTLQVMRQSAGLLETIQAGGGDLPTWGAIFGKREFISEEALRWQLNQHPGGEAAACARAWQEAGGRSGGSPSWQRAWLADDLLDATNGAFEIDDWLRLDDETEDSDAGMASYQAQFSRDQQPALILCTHAMLAREILSRIMEAGRLYREEHGERAMRAVVGRAFEQYANAREAFSSESLEQGRFAERPAFAMAEAINSARAEMGVDQVRLPPLSFVIIDEAHVFETNVANTLSKAFSCWSLLEAMRALRRRRKLVTDQDLEKAERIYKRLQNVIPKQTAGRAAAVSQDDTLGSEIKQLKLLVFEITGRWKKTPADRGDAELRILGDARMTLSLILPERPSGHRMYLRHSPVQRHPLLISERSDVSVELDYLWRCMADQSVLVSATLCIDGDLHPIEYMRRILAIPVGAAEFAAPVRPGWLTAPVRLLLPREAMREDGGIRFRPPTRSDHFRTPTARAQARTLWLNEVAEYLHDAAQTAQGGTLVLLTSYDDCAELVELSRIAARRIVEMERGMSLRQVLEKFYRKADADIRPVLFAVGGAWTGLNISAEDRGVEAKDDNLLTDLVIPRIPFGANSTMTHTMRVEQQGSLAESYATAMLLKQGIGRLVRREGLPDNRRIHLLDGRLNDRKFYSFMTPVRQVLTPYERRVLV